MRIKGAVTPPHSAPVLPMPPGNPAVSFTSHSASLSEASKRVCMTAGAQWPIFNRFDTLRRRSVGVETLVRSPIRFRGTAGEGTGAVFAELVVAIACPPDFDELSELATQGIRSVQVSAPGGVVR